MKRGGKEKEIIERKNISKIPHEVNILCREHCPKRKTVKPMNFSPASYSSGTDRSFKTALGDSTECCMRGFAFVA